MPAPLTNFRRELLSLTVRVAIDRLASRGVTDPATVAGIIRAEAQAATEQAPGSLRFDGPTQHRPHDLGNLHRVVANSCGPSPAARPKCVLNAVDAALAEVLNL